MLETCNTAVASLNFSTNISNAIYSKLATVTTLAYNTDIRAECVDHVNYLINCSLDSNLIAQPAWLTHNSAARTFTMRPPDFGEDITAGVYKVIISATYKDIGFSNENRYATTNCTITVLNTACEGTTLTDKTINDM